uniref:Hypotheticial protein n=1 Tax=Schistosoma japonicum TaxID=6182 RepID=C1LKD6_SCHJA|nr:hypotheticial protein [Schistosoma japonicum]
MLFTMLIVIVSLHSFVLTYANNSTNNSSLYFESVQNIWKVIFLNFTYHLVTIQHSTHLYIVPLMLLIDVNQCNFFQAPHRIHLSL